VRLALAADEEEPAFPWKAASTSFSIASSTGFMIATITDPDDFSCEKIIKADEIKGDNGDERQVAWTGPVVARKIFVSVFSTRALFMMHLQCSRMISINIKEIIAMKKRVLGERDGRYRPVRRS